MPTTLHLIDRLASAEVEAPGPNHVAVQRITIGRDTRMSLFQHPFSRITFAAVELGSRPVIRLGMGLKEACWDLIQSAVMFQVFVEDRRKRSWQVLERVLDARAGRAGRGWLTESIDLSRFRGQVVRLAFVTAVPEGDSTEYCWAGWSDPIIEHEVRAARPVVRKDHDRHVVLITSDALRADHLGCYGHPLVQTPNLDRLAEDGCLFCHARAQTTTTPGAYASIFTSRHAPEHGILAEWGQVRAGLPTLPGHLQKHGYHTLCASSEAEMADPARGMSHLFQESIPCFGAPAQSGDVTARQFIDWLDSRPHRPFFAWVHFFDTHPPVTPPEPFRSMYYRGNPADPVRCFNPEGVRGIHGVESVEAFSRVLEPLGAGVIDADLLIRLEHTAEALAGGRNLGPDLVAHLRALGPAACGGKAPAEFAAWLAAQVASLRRGVVELDLVPWIRSTMPLLARIEADILSWLSGVVDYRYPLAQYMASVSYLDHHVGRVIQALRQRDLYDRAVLVFTSPHGEMLGEHGVNFHHHALTEQVLRVPLIIKPVQGNTVSCGQRRNGIFDHIDIAPTVLEALGLPPLPGGVGVSRWASLQTGLPIGEHDSFAVDCHARMLSLNSSSHVLLKALRPCVLSADWIMREGDTALFELRQPMDYTRDLRRARPEIARAMEERLDRWYRALSGAAPARAA